MSTNCYFDTFLIDTEHILLYIKHMEIEIPNIKAYHVKDFDTHEKTMKEAESAADVRMIYLDVLDGKKKSAAEIRAGARLWEYYGIWFCGAIGEAIQQTTGSRRVFLDHAKLTEGEHRISVYGTPCTLFFWIAQGYYRGIVLADQPEQMIAQAWEVMNKRSWDPTGIYKLFTSGHSGLDTIIEGISHGN